ncbi:unnamed protein product, partial [marine sediment metagenome]
LGVNPYQSVNDTMRTMVRAYHGAESEFTGNVATQHGHDHEATAIGDYELDTGATVQQDPDFVIHKEYDWMGCTPDGLMGNEGLIEVKCPYYAKKPYTLEEKPMYLYQVYFQLIVTGAAWCDFYVWLPGEQHCERVHYFNAKKWFDKNFDKIEEFYNQYLEIRDNEKLSGPHLEDKEMDLSEDLEWTIIAGQYLRAKKQLESAKTRIDDLKTELLRIAKDNGKKCVGAGVMAYKATRKGSVNYKKID